MQIKINTKDFTTALNIGGAMAGKNRTLPILDCAKITIGKNSSCTIVSYDGEVAMYKKCQIEQCEESGSFCVNPRELTNILKTIRENTIDLKIEENNCIVLYGSGQISIPIQPSEDFPNIERDADSVSVNVKSEILYNELKDALPFVGTDNIRPVLCGIHLSVNGQQMSISATDTHYLYNNTIDTGNNIEGTSEAIIPNKSISNILNIINKSEVVKLTFGENNVCFIVEGAMLMSRKVIGKFPNVQSVIPSNNICVEINKEEFKSALERAILVSNSKTQCLKFTTSNDNLIISSEDIDFNKKCEEKCACTIFTKDGSEYEDFTFAVKGENMVICINSVKNENVILELNGAKKAILVYDKDMPSKSVITMPLAIQ